MAKKREVLFGWQAFAVTSLCLLAGIFWYLRHAVPPKIAATTTKPPLRQASVQPVSSKRAASTPVAHEKDSSDADYEDLLEMYEAGEVPTTLSFFSGPGRFSAECLEMFKITPAEHDRLKEVVQKSREELSQLQKQHAKITYSSGNTVKVTVEAFPAEGGELYDKMISSCAEILGGGARGDAFERLCGLQFEQSLGGAMGCDRMKVMISGGKSGWTVVTSNFGDVGPTIAGMSEFASFDSMKQQLGALADVAKH